VTKMSQSDFDNCMFQQEDPEPDRKKAGKLDTQKFWGLWVPAGILAGFVACIIGQSGAYFLPVGGVATFLLWAGSKSE
jgi:hypothetical protein